MTTRPALIAAAGVFALFAGSAAHAGAADPCYTIASGVMRCNPQGERTREDVQAELRAARAAGQLNKAGELAEPGSADTAAPAPALTRNEVRTQVLVARAAHQLPAPGELE